MHAHGNTASARPDFHGSCANFLVKKKCVFSVYSLCIFQQILLSILRYENGNEHDTFHHNKNISKNLTFKDSNGIMRHKCVTLVSPRCNIFNQVRRTEISLQKPR